MFYVRTLKFKYPIEIISLLSPAFLLSTIAINRSLSQNGNSSPNGGGTPTGGYDNPTFRRGFSFASAVPFSYLTSGNSSSRFSHKPIKHILYFY